MLYIVVMQRKLQPKMLNLVDAIYYKVVVILVTLYDQGGHQQLRERIAQQYPNKLVICLPQTIHFDSEDRLAASAAILLNIPTSIFVRDVKSLELRNALPIKQN